MTNFRKLNNITGWVVFAIAAIVYILTLEPTTSWWDPGEHISTAYKLQIGHPPGAPTFGLMGRFFSLFAFGDTTKVAFMINMVSGLSSAFTILFLFWTITMMARKIIAPKQEITLAQTWTILSAGIVGALTFTFSDSFWFSAVEANVFAMSLFCTAIVVWAIFKWEQVAHEKHHYKWLIFIAFMIGLSIGVHLLNLLTIPALAFVFYFKKYKPTPLGIFLNLLVSFFILAFIMYYLIPGIPKLAGQFELIFTNGFGFPFNTGMIVYFTLFIGLIIWGLWYTRKKSKPVLNTLILCVAFLLTGYSSFVILVIRSNAATPINEDAPKDPVSLVSFLNREQYGTWPFLYGQYYTAPVIDYGDGTPLYKKDLKSGKYIVIDDRKGVERIYDPRFTSIFPRMWSTQRKNAASFYREWGGPGRPIEVNGEDGKTTTLNKPTFTENLRFFFTYQVSWMYLRYFMWNFVGRQNDEQGFGGIKNGNWITGIPFIDKARVGRPVSDLPDSLKNMANHKYFMLPFLLGLAGMFYQFKKNSQWGIVVLLLFLMTGLAIVTYLNQQPYEPRERDYSYAASFFAFAIWVGLGVLFVVDFLMTKVKMKEMMAVAVAGLLSVILVPGLMAEQNWHDHDRSGKYAARDYAANYLNSCDKNAILFTNGDNDTFPLWYNQEVEGVRTDVRNVNYELASGGWYVQQMFNKVYDSPPLPFTLQPIQYQEGTNDYIPYYDSGIKDYIDLKDFIDFIKSDDPQTFLTSQNGGKYKFFPAKKIKMAVDVAACLKNGIVPDYYSRRVVDTIYWTIKSNYLTKNDLMMLDIMATNKWQRPVYFAAPSSVSHCFDVDRFCHLEGWVYKLMPVRTDSASYIPGMGGIDAMGSYNIFMNKCKWGNLNDPKVYIDPESRSNSYRSKMEIARTAEALINLGKSKEANTLLDMFFKYFPESKFPYDQTVLPYIDLYYRTGEVAKANKLAERLTQIICQNLDYYRSFSGNDQLAFQNDTEMDLGIMQQIHALTSRNHQDKLTATVDSLFKLNTKGYAK
ncbi:MAG: DUF2723 domain-containing protein [Bacteroidota bacterium]